MNKKEKFDLANWAVDYAKSNGAQEVSVSIYNYIGSDVTVRKQKIEKIQESIENGLSLKLYVDGKYSSHSTNRLKKTDLKRFVVEAIAATKYLAEDKFRVLPDPSLYFKEDGMDLKLYDKSYYDVDPKDKIEFAMKTEAETLNMDDRIIAVTCDYGDSLVSRVKVISNGFQAYNETTSFSVSASAAVKSGDARPSDYDYVNSRFIKDIDIKGVGKNAVRRALKKLNHDKLKSGKYPMIVENRVVGRLVSSIFSAINGSNIQQKRSFLEGMLGKKIASNKLSITDNPFIVSGQGSRLFDGEGMAAKKMSIVNNGVLDNYYLDTYYGKKLNMNPTTAGSSNIEFAHGDKDLNQLIKSINRGVLVTEFNGGNSNGATGDFSYGVSGFLVENGSVVKPVAGLNITGNYKTFWNQLLEVGNDELTNRSMRTASMLFDDVDFSGI